MTRVALVAIEDCAAYSLSTAAGLLRLANKGNALFGHRHAPFQWQVVARTTAPVRTGIDVAISPDVGIDESDGGTSTVASQSFDIICVPDLYFTDELRLLRILAESAPLATWIGSQWRAGARIMAFGAGSFLVAESGILDRRACTTAPALAALFCTRYPRARYQQGQTSTVTREGRIQCNATHPQDVEVLQRLISSCMDSRIAAQCARWILSDAGLPSGSSEMTLSVDTALKDPLTAKVDRWIRRNLSRRAGIDDMARHAGTSVRSLYRHLRSATGLTPAAYLQKHRIEAAQHLLSTTRHSVAEIARRVGYTDTSAFSRVFRHCTGTSPRASVERKTASRRQSAPHDGNPL